MNTRVLSALVALVLLAAVAGCSDNDSELQRVVCEVQLVNAGAPLLSAYVQDGGDGVIGGADPDDSYPSDAVLVAFRARPYSTSVTNIGEDDTYSSYIITSYNVHWVPGVGVPANLDLSAFDVVDAPFYLQVPINDEAAGGVLVVDRALKEAIASELGYGWTFDQDFSAYAMLEFTGHDSGSQHESVIEAGLAVNFTFAVSQE